MKFKEFIKLKENRSTENGLMGVPIPSSVRKPSDGQPFKNLSSFAGQTPQGSNGGGGFGGPAMNAGPKMMKKMMKKD